MNGVAMELDETLRRLEPPAAAALEQLVRGALTLAARTPAPVARGAVDANGYPVGYFEETAGSFADEPLDVSDDLPPEPTPDW